MPKNFFGNAIVGCCKESVLFPSIDETFSASIGKYIGVLISFWLFLFAAQPK
jgi:hypothetical protein